MDKNAALTVEVENGKLTISIGISTLCYATIQAPHYNNWQGKPAINDEAAFAAAVRAALLGGDADGTNLAQRMLDAAAAKALEGGCAGTHLP